MTVDNNWIRRKALESIYHAKSGHPSGVLSAMDIIDFVFSFEIDYYIIIISSDEYFDEIVKEAKALVKKPLEFLKYNKIGVA